MEFGLEAGMEGTVQVRIARARQRRFLIILLGVLMTTSSCGIRTLAASCSTPHPHAFRSGKLKDGSPSTYLTAKNYFAPPERTYGPPTLEVADRSSGRSLGVLIQCRTHVGLAAARGSDGSVIAVMTLGCHSDVQAVDPQN